MSDPLDVYVTRAATSTPEQAHKRRVYKVQGVLVDLSRGTIRPSKARFMLEAAGLAPDAARTLVESAVKNLVGVR